MDISRKTDYTLRMMAALAQDDTLKSVRQVAEENIIPYSFARSIQHSLMRAGYIESVRGSRGGIKILVDPHDITLLDLVKVTQGDIHLTHCESAGPDGGMCLRSNMCEFHPIWRGACEMLNDFLESITLADIIEGKSPVLPEKYWSHHAFDDFMTKRSHTSHDV